MNTDEKQLLFDAIMEVADTVPTPTSLEDCYRAARLCAERCTIEQLPQVYALVIRMPLDVQAAALKTMAMRRKFPLMENPLYIPWIGEPAALNQLITYRDGYDGESHNSLGEDVMSQSSSILADAAVRITMRYPFWSEIFYSMTVVDNEPQVTTLATDGRNLYVNPQFYAGLSLDRKVAAVAHEMCHKIFLHCTRRGNRDPQLWNEAADHATNTLLKKNGFDIAPEWVCDMKYEGWLVETIYKDLVQEQKDNPNRKGMSPDWQDIRESDMTPEEKERYEVEVKALVERAVANAKAMGRLPAGIDAGIVECFKAPKEAWYNTLHRYMQTLSSSEYNWARLNRRTLRSHGTFSPLHLSEALGDIVLLIDTSGSCYDKAQQSNFCGHLNAILAEARPHKVHVYYFDTRVYQGETIEAGEFDIALRPKGGGGTDFRELFTSVEADGVYPEVAIVLTDLCGPFGDEPGYPVVWASTEDAVAPFGETIYVD